VDFKTASIQKEENGLWTLPGNPEKRKEQVIKKKDAQKTEKVLTYPALPFSLEDPNLVCPVALL